MEKIINDNGFETLVKMDVEEATKVCRLGQGEKCCAFLVMGTTFECCRMVPTLSGQIFSRLAALTMNAKGEGSWEGCPWETK